MMLNMFDSDVRKTAWTEFYDHLRSEEHATTPRDRSRFHSDRKTVDIFEIRQTNM